MKALLLADLYIIRKYTRAFLAMVVLFLGVSAFETGETFLLVYPVLMASILSTSVLSYNERFHWDSYCDTLPISRAQVVSEKYLLSLLMTGTVFILTALLELRLLYTGALSREDYFMTLDMLAVLAFFAPSLMLPIIFKLGMEKGRMAYYIIFGVAFAITVFLPERLLEAGGLTRGPLTLLALLLVCALFFVGSWRLAIRFYKAREL